MRHSLLHVALVVRDYDEAIAFFTEVLGFDLVEDTDVPEQGKRWVRVRPHGSDGAALLLARASTPEQEAAIGNQTDLRASLDRSPAVAIYKQWVGAVGVGYDVQSRREQTFPAYAGSINLEKARTTR